MACSTVTVFRCCAWQCLLLALCVCLQLPPSAAFSATGALSRRDALRKLAVPVVRPVRGVLFHLEGAVVDTHAAHVQAYQQALAAVPSMPKVAAHNTQLLKRLVATHATAGSIQQGRPEVGVEEDDMVVRALAPAATTNEVRLVRSQKDRVYTELRDRLLERPLRGFEAMVQMLRRHHIPVAVLTDSSVGEAEKILEALGVREVAAGIVAPIECGAWFPDPAPYLTALQALREQRQQQGADQEPELKAEDCLAFDGSLNGVASAVQAGIPTVGVTTAHSEHELIQAGAVLATKHFAEPYLWQLLACVVDIGDDEGVALEVDSGGDDDDNDDGGGGT